MKLFTSMLVAAVAAIGVASAQEMDEKDVCVLTKDNFKATLEENDFVLAEFYAPWCGHCKALAPEYAKAATELSESSDEVLKAVKLCKVDATVEDDLAKEFGVQGFPTLKWIVKGDAKDYSGGRTQSTIVNWIKKKVMDPATEVKSAEDFAALKEENEVLSVLVVDSADAIKESAFFSAASDEDEVPFVYVVGDNFGVECASAPCLFVYQAFEGEEAEKQVFSGDVNEAAEISKFVKGNSLPAVVAFSQETAPRIFGGDIKNHALIFMDGSKADEKATIIAEAKKVALKNKGEMLFVTVDKSDERILEFFGLKPEDLPTVRIVNMDGAMKKFEFANAEGKAFESVTEASLGEFVTLYQEDKLKPAFKSADIPETNDEPVKVIVGKNFDDFVGGDKAVLLEFYAPWCGHCKKLAPIYDDLGEHYKDSDKVTIAKMDATENEVDGVNVSGFPTLKFFAAGSKEAQDYDGERTKEAFISFLDEKLA